MPRLLPLDRQVWMPWRNGGGETREVAAWPAQASLDTFLWRVSVASIERDGPFSRVPRVSRTLVLLDGAGVRLTGPVTRLDLAHPYAPVVLSGAEPVHCELRKGAVRMFNVMVRGERASEIAVAAGRSGEVPATPWRVCYAARGATSCRAEDAVWTLGEGDALALDAPSDGSMPLHVMPAAAHAVALIALIDPAEQA
jgi:environmental stress-induced protein Ves